MESAHFPRAAFLCKTCGEQLTDFLGSAAEASLDLRAGEAAVAQDRYVELARSWTYRDFIAGVDGSFYVSPDGDIVAFSAGDFLLNVDAVRHAMKAGASFGCCGWQPRDEINATCANLHDIGTVHSDCWASAVLRLRPDLVEKVLLDE